MAPVQAALLVGGILLYCIFIFLLIYVAHNWYKKSYEASQTQLSDVELFRLMNANQGYMTPEELADRSTLTVKQAKKRLGHLAQRLAIKGFYDIYGSTQTVYQLLQFVPMVSAPMSDIHQAPDKDVVQQLFKYSSNGQITIPEVMTILNLSLAESKKLLRRLKRQKYLSIVRQGMYPIYLVRQSFSNVHKKSQPTTEPSDLRIALPTPKERLAIPDAEVLQLAIENGGRLTPAVLCVKGKIPIEEAKRALDALYDSGAFSMDADPSHSVMEYRLRDPSLLG